MSTRTPRPSDGTIVDHHHHYGASTKHLLSAMLIVHWMAKTGLSDSISRNDMASRTSSAGAWRPAVGAARQAHTRQVTRQHTQHLPLAVTGAPGQPLPWINVMGSGRVALLAVPEDLRPWVHLTRDLGYEDYYDTLCRSSEHSGVSPLAMGWLDTTCQGRHGVTAGQPEDARDQQCNCLLLSMLPNSQNSNQEQCELCRCGGPAACTTNPLFMYH